MDTRTDMEEAARNLVAERNSLRRERDMLLTVWRKFDRCLVKYPVSMAYPLAMALDDMREAVAACAPEVKP